MKEKIHIACTIDNNYAQHFAAMLASVFLNNEVAEIEIHLITNELSDKNKAKLTTLLSGKKFDFRFYRVDESMLQGAPVSLHVSLATYYRILLPSILPSDLDKVLFLDSDLVVRTNLKPLWQTELNGFFLAACTEYFSVEYKMKLGMKPDSLYFNAGVLLINLKLWREQHIIEKALDFIEHYKPKITYWDQDTLNFILEKKWLRISNYWNVHHAFYSSAFNHLALGLSELEFQHLKSDPGILHFAGSDKPWDFYNKHPLRTEYYKYLAYTPWHKFKPQDPNSFGKKATLVVKNYVQKFYRAIS